EGNLDGTHLERHAQGPDGPARVQLRAARPVRRLLQVVHQPPRTGPEEDLHPRTRRAHRGGPGGAPSNPFRGPSIRRQRTIHPHSEEGGGVTVQLADKLHEAAEAARQSVATMRRAIHATDPNSFPPPLKAKKAGKGYLITADDLRDWLDSLPDA